MPVDRAVVIRKNRLLTSGYVWESSESLSHVYVYRRRKRGFFLLGVAYDHSSTRYAISNLFFSSVLSFTI